MSLSNLVGNASRRNRTLQNYLATKSLTACCALFVVLTLLLATAAWGQEKVLYSFTGGADGGAPIAGLVRDAAGNLYGATPGGGDTEAEPCQTEITGCGVVFELTPGSGGTWTESVLHTFIPGTDGINPFGNLIFDSVGNLYGTTQYGGTGCPGSFYGCGTVYELSPAGGGLWTETILFNFNVTDGVYPPAGLVFDHAGNLYGTTGFGANTLCNTLGCGTVFELTPSGSTWTEHILYTFQDGADGAEPGSAVVFDTAGNLYGTAAIGGNTTTCNSPYGCGTIYELSPSSGVWTESVIHIFECGAGGCFPNSGLTIDSLGNLYGNMSAAGANGYGYVYKLSPQTGGGFKFNSIYSFDLVHGGQPEGTLLFAGGGLYGTASDGGSDNRLCGNGCGGVFHLSPTGSGINYSFLGFGTAPKGATPKGNLIPDPAGNLYGTTSAGGANGAGTVFEIMR
ncbi:MAG: choice-of-anchor tandem repeat GloVer-containing protein [Candidatus Sulfotelmatobacter sp.]